MTTELERVLRERAAEFRGWSFERFLAIPGGECFRDATGASGTRYAFTLSVTDISGDLDESDRLELEFRVATRTPRGDLGDALASPELRLDRGETWNGELGELRHESGRGHGWIAVGCFLLLAVGVYLYVRYT